MRGIERPITYFNQAGYENTSDVVEIVFKRLKEGDIKSVVVASSRGETGLRFAKRMARETNLVIVIPSRVTPRPVSGISSSRFSKN